MKKIIYKRAKKRITRDIVVTYELYVNNDFSIISCNQYDRTKNTLCTETVREIKAGIKEAKKILRLLVRYNALVGLFVKPIQKKASLYIFCPFMSGKCGLPFHKPFLP